MPTTTYNVTEAASPFGDGDGGGNGDAFQFRENDPTWFTTPAFFGDDPGKGATGRNWVLDRFVLDVPEGATVRRVTVSKEPQVDDAWTSLGRFCILDPQPAHSHPASTEDGLNAGNANWLTADAARDTPFVWSDWEVNTAVYDDAGVEREHPEAFSRSGHGGQLNVSTLRGMGTIGGAFTAQFPTPPFDLGEIRLRISRTVGALSTDDDTDANTSRPGLDLRIEFYRTISATDRRPSGSPIATSNTVSWDSLDFGGTPGPNPLTTNWGVFVFPTTPTLEQGDDFVYKLVVDGGGVMPLGSPLIRFACDQGYDVNEDRTRAFTNNAAGVYWGSGGFGGSAYPPQDGLPNTSETDPPGALVAGRVFQDDECRFPKENDLIAFFAGTRFVWGFDLDGGPGIDHEFDGSHVDDTTDIVTLFQNWIDRLEYDEAGTITGIVFDIELLNPEAEQNTFATQEDPTDVGTELIIGWVLVPTKATVPSPANLAIDVNLSATLSWVSGIYPGTAPGNPTHDVYFGTTPTPGAPEFQGNQLNGNTTFDPGLLAADTTYFWRIDEVGPFGTTTGDVWQFTTPEFVTAVDKRTEIFLAEARLCQADPESRSFTFADIGRASVFDAEVRSVVFPNPGSRVHKFDPDEERTFKFPPESRKCP